MKGMLISGLEERFKRWKKFYESNEPALMVSAEIVDNAASGIGNRQCKLSDFNFLSESDHYLYLDNVVENHIQYLQTRPDISDDYIPHLFLYYGQAIFNAFVVDRTVRFIDDTSWAEPCIIKWSDIDKLEMDENNYCFRLYLDGSRYLKQKLDGISFMTGANDYGPMDLANALRGNELFVDFFDHPEEVHKLISFCADAIIWRGDAKRKIIGEIQGGSICLFGAWKPGDTGIMSLDASIMTSPEIFREFEAPYIQRIVDHCGGYAFYVHGARHQFLNYADIRKAQIFQLTDDPNIKRPIDELESIINVFGTTPLIISATPKQIRENIGVLRKGRIFITTVCDSATEAKEIIKLIRDNSRIGV